VGSPFFAASLRQIRVPRAFPGRAVDEFPEDVGVPQVLGRLDAHMHKDLVERHVAPFLRPPRHVPGSIERERLDGCIAMLGRKMVQFDDFLPGAGSETEHLLSAVAPVYRRCMAKLIYAGIMSLDGYTADSAGKFDWSMPDEEVHTFVNDLQRPVGTYLYGRRMYEVMAVWEDMSLSQAPPFIQDYARIWRAADKIVYSTSLENPSSARTRIERDFDAGAIRALKEASERDMSIGGTTLAAQAINAGLVDEFDLFLTPVVVGGGKQFLPDGVGMTLELLDERRFSNGVVYLRYAKGA
jgi:dihydrofolate reductase